MSNVVMVVVLVGLYGFGQVAPAKSDRKEVGAPASKAGTSQSAAALITVTADAHTLPLMARGITFFLEFRGHALARSFSVDDPGAAPITSQFSVTDSNEDAHLGKRLAYGKLVVNCAGSNPKRSAKEYLALIVRGLEKSLIELSE